MPLRLGLVDGELALKMNVRNKTPLSDGRAPARSERQIHLLQSRSARVTVATGCWKSYLPFEPRFDPETRELPPPSVRKRDCELELFGLAGILGKLGRSLIDC